MEIGRLEKDISPVGKMKDGIRVTTDELFTVEARLILS
jgi:hypothetical protein